jgi:hypothetical protein
MFMEKIRRGVLQIHIEDATDTDIRYVEPSLAERLQLLWTFRNFNILYEEILTAHERHLIAQLCAQERTSQVDPLTACIIGTVELPAKKRPCSARGEMRRNLA